MFRHKNQCYCNWTVLVNNKDFQHNLKYHILLLPSLNFDALKKWNKAISSSLCFLTENVGKKKRKSKGQIFSKCSETRMQGQSIYLEETGR